MRVLKVFWIVFVFMLTILYSTEAAIQRIPPKIDNNLEKDSKLLPCIKTLLDEAWIPSGSHLSKSAQGTLTVTNEGEIKIYFNVILKTSTGKKGDPPIYLRFVKVAQLDIRKVLEYAKAGDEIFIEQYTIDGNQRVLCAPSSLTVT
ncbi:MAG: hypothetical protein M9888_10275 [Chitinophagales bacterium]|nr:hypothetical protein [Chitinophagales bacterium]